MTDALRLAFGTLSIVPVRPPASVSRRTGSWAMVLAPLVGAVLSLPAVVVLWILEDRASPLLASALVVALLAALTRGMHLDGLADTADGLGSRKPAAEALDIMRQGDVGPFGVASIALGLVLQVAALAGLAAEGRGPFAVFVALLVSRLVLPLLCSRGIPAARPEGLGRLVAGSVGRLQLSVVVAATFLAAALLDLSAFPTSITATVLAGVVGLLAGGLLGWRCVRRLGGVTGDVLGGCVEVTFTAVLVALAVG